MYFENQCSILMTKHLSCAQASKIKIDLVFIGIPGHIYAFAIFSFASSRARES